jgi:hypothetical protein
LASPEFTGIPLAPTAAVDTSTTQIATTEFVQQELANMQILTLFRRDNISPRFNFSV